jgi:hypothetical protein
MWKCTKGKVTVVTVAACTEGGRGILVLINNKRTFRTEFTDRHFKTKGFILVNLNRSGGHEEHAVVPCSVGTDSSLLEDTVKPRKPAGVQMAGVRTFRLHANFCPAVRQTNYKFP